MASSNYHPSLATALNPPAAFGMLRPQGHRRESLTRTLFIDFLIAVFRITLKNYRCFSDQQPASLDFSPGFTAFTGTNNSGKSTFLRVFLEFRSLFEALTNPSMYAPGREVGMSTSYIEDWFELFHNGNTRDISLVIENTLSKPEEVAKVRFFLSRGRPNMAILDLWVRTSNGLQQAELVAGANVFEAKGQRVRGTTDGFIEFGKAISRSFYVGPFRNAISEGAGKYYDMSIGTTFISQWDQWKTGSSRMENEAAQKVADDIAHIFDFKRLEINATPDKKSIQIIINGKPLRLRELGAGLAQFIIVFGNVAIRRPSLLLIDEPELNLHPSLQIDFLTSLTSYTSYGVAFATHSVGLARAVADRISTFQKSGEESLVKPFEQTPNFAEFVGEMSFSSFKEIGCDTILLVEGVTEVKAVQQFLRALRKDHKIVLVPLGGSQFLRGGVQQELAELSRLSKNVAVLIDSEVSSDGAALDAGRQQFVQECQALGFRVHVTRRRAFENYLTDSAVKEEKGQNCRALAEYEARTNAPHAWAKSDNWRIARRMTESEILGTDVGIFLNQI